MLFRSVSEAGRLAPLKQAIVEMPADASQFEARDPHTDYIGRKLANTGDGGRTQPCATCHGPALRSGPDLEGPPLHAVVSHLTQADMIDLAAYAASLKP